MSGPGESLIPHEPPKDFPEASLVGVEVPTAFHGAILKAAAKKGCSYQELLLEWAQRGAECERLNHEAKLTAGR